MVANRHEPEENLGFVLADISRLARKEFDRRVRDLGLTRSQWLFLAHLARQPGCSQSELADRLQMEKITISRQAQRLLRAGWIERRDHAEDRRAYHLHLTARAEAMVDRLAERAAALRAEYFRGLSRARRAALMADLQQIKTNLVRLEARTRRRFHETI